MERIARQSVGWVLGPILAAASLCLTASEGRVPAERVFDQTARDLTPTAVHRAAARDLVHALVVSFEQYAADVPGAGASNPVRSLMTRLPARARNGLVAATRRFSAQGESGLKAFYGTRYAPTPQARFQQLPVIARSLELRRPAMLRLPVIGRGALSGPMASIPVFDIAGPPQKSFSAPYNVRLRLTLQNIRVDRLNDDDTPEDEIYLGVLAVPGPVLLTRIPGGDTYYRLARGQSKGTNLTIRDFGVVRPGQSFSAFVSVFEYDDGTWGEIWSTFIDIAEFAFNTWLQSEIGVVAAEVVECVMDDLWSWVAGWFENPDDFIDTVLLFFDYEREPKFWAPDASGSPHVTTSVARQPSGADASYRLSFLWDLSRVAAVR